jgi:hypothetical protein
MMFYLFAMTKLVSQWLDAICVAGLNKVKERRNMTGMVDRARCVMA